MRSLSLHIALDAWWSHWPGQDRAAQIFGVAVAARQFSGRNGGSATLTPLGHELVRRFRCVEHAERAHLDVLGRRWSRTSRCPSLARRSRDFVVEPTPVEAVGCWLCGRPLGRKIEWHHPKPKSRGGRETAPVHPICHRTIHASFSNAELARMAENDTALSEQPEMARFLAWIAGKPPDFRAPTRRRR